MREIKFRAWDKKENKMKSVIQLLWGHEIAQQPISVNFFESIKSRLYKDIVLMQFTGMHDESYKEIYEGDIIKTQMGNFEVKWWSDNCSWCLEKKDGWREFLNGNLGNHHTNQVIGNIYQNKELLK